MSEIELLSISEVSKLLYRQTSAIRHLVTLGKLSVTREGRTYRIHADSVAAFIARQPHPIQLMSTMYFCFNVMGSEKRQANVEAEHRWSALEIADDMSSAFQKHYLEKIMPVMQTFLVALKEKRYEEAEALRHEMWQIDMDYHMLHEPMESEQNHPEYQSPTWAQDKGVK